MARKIKVLVVEDSAATRDFLVHLLKRDPELEVIGTAKDGEVALEFLRENKPDVITMDIHMPKMDGFETTRKIMETQPVPVVIVTGTTDPKEVATLFHAMDAGALAVLPIPAGFGHPEHEVTSRELIQTLKSMSEVKVVRRWARGRISKIALPTPPEETKRKTASEVRVIAIGASTGGPPVLQTILSSLPASFPVPILVVQHIATGFMTGFVEWLASSCRIRIQIASQHQALCPGTVYLAPDDFQMTVSSNGLIILRDDPPENGLRPAVSCLFRSVAEVFGKSAVGILLTGMGRDGAAELKRIKDAGGITIAQSRETCVINGMPGTAVNLDAATYTLSPEQIAAVLTDIAKNHECAGFERTHRNSHR